MSIKEAGSVGTVEKTLPVRISYEIIHLFSEGLYKSPHKAVEELVSNSYDAGAEVAHVLLPDDQATPLWVIDDGTGMDGDGFQKLWQIAHSPKSEADAPEFRGRKPIGQFGIGKLAAYVLAWRITHISKSESTYLVTSLDFRSVDDLHQWETGNPVELALRRISEGEAKRLLADVEARSPEAWSLMFGMSAAPSWTAAGLSDFKALMQKLRPGTLSWVIRTGLPLTSDFTVTLNGDSLQSAKTDWTPIQEFKLGGGEDQEATKLGFTQTATGLLIPGIQGEVSGTARIYERPLQGGKSDQYHRSNGFFIRVRNRVINLEDELFGLPAQNHAAWSRFELSADIDGLRDFLQSSREGVRDAEQVDSLRTYLLRVFLAARRAYMQWQVKQTVGDDIYRLVNSAPPALIRDPLIHALQKELTEGGQQLYYIQAPLDVTQEASAEWLEAFTADITERLFESIELHPGDRYTPIGTFEASTRQLRINEDHPFISHLVQHSRNPTPAKLFAVAEILTDPLLRQSGIPDALANDFLASRDRILRALVADFPHVGRDILGLLDVADQNDTALETAVGAAFGILGFEYDRRGGNRGGPDGVLLARLGVQAGRVADFKLVFDAKTTGAAAIPSGQVHFDGLRRFLNDERADHAFVVGKAFDAQNNPAGAINSGAKEFGCSVLTTSDVRRLVTLHLRYGIPLSRVRELFATCHTALETGAWIDELASELSEQEGQVPIRLLLEGLHSLKEDDKAPPTLSAVRQTVPELKRFTPDKLQAVLEGLGNLVGRGWIDIDPHGNVRLEQTPDLLIDEVHRALGELGLANGLE
jgi:hypothetical protein